MGFARGAGAPPAETDNDRLQLLAPIGQLVDLRRRRRREPPPTHDTSLLQPAQTLGQNVGTGLRQASPQVREPLRPQQQLAYYQERPALAHKVERMRRGTPVIVCASCHYTMSLPP